MRHFALLTFFVSLFLQARVIEAPLNPINYQQNPPALEWKVIETAHFEIIFPKEIERDAQRVAHLLEKAYPFVARSPWFFRIKRPPLMPL